MWANTPTTEHERVTEARANSLGMRRHFLLVNGRKDDVIATAWWTADGERVVWSRCEIDPVEPQPGSRMPVVLTWHVSGLTDGGEFSHEVDALEEWLRRNT